MEGKKRVAVIFGGQSSEHEVSRVSAESIIRNINRDKFDVVMIGITKDGRWLTYDGPVDKIGSGEWQAIAEAKALSGSAEVKKLAVPMNTEACETALAGASAGNIFEAAGVDKGKGAIDVVFPVLHGCNGEDGTIQGLLELAGIPYVGCGVLGSALGMDKAYAKIIFEKAGIPQGRYLVFNRKQIKQDRESIIDQVEKTFTYPCFVKPSNAGSSVGISKAHDRGELIDALELAAKYDRRILVEEFIDGREIECAVLGNDDPIASTVGEIIPGNEFYDYNAKYLDDNSKAVIPADLPESTIRTIREYAIRAFKALDCSGLSRVDFFVHKETGEIYINEINTLPGFTSISMYPQLWEASGIPYGELIERLIDLAIERFEDNKREFDQ
ncbi:D-alanine--D-alanine ligase A [Clostridium thermosuccinogenes]|jgi:D-alanine-D-alanine ligase|uniref:D-alanine--D-alanine ligase n=1 Tax=Clostridium thermosuccinogenes TaxID=84032 RepID=A0A2K2FAV4_9CLOT|nr:D-alanine--D-alanine ligase family protein [Pseudoclostridium thermosuccinogenes]AUS97776.1 D-alanine--D-alanine ligase A [Pseudoclostridium thermosuccinogenes]PNT95888.1 D-alanine--D-alanine ligase A [Pseudoclostridium thermosuccinogenes]PNT97210.1 D-alanine--D-alanine ligase A [Pseudoclostridium thermosuccinogenes]